MRTNFSRFSLTCKAIALGLLLSIVLAAIPADAVNVAFDYSYDTEGFFDDPARRELVEMAARHVNRYVDPLQAIVSSGDNSWFTFTPTAPDLSDKFLYDMEIPADTIKVITGGSSILPVNNLSQTTVSPGSPLSGTPEWSDLVSSRGQVGALESSPTDFGNWGAAMTINSDDVKFHFGKTTEGLDPDETDFLTLAMHELMHVFGFGPSDSFIEQIDLIDLKYQGAEAQSVGSGTNPQLRLNDGGHWASTTQSFAGGQDQKALMTPAIYPGERKFPTLLDRAVLRDVGWQEALPGDVNLDGKFDTLDVVDTLQADKYLSEEVAAWADGDWNDDFRFDQRDIVAALSTGNYLSGSYLAVAPEGDAGDGQTSVFYDAATGEVAVEPSDGMVLTSLSIESATGIFTRDSAVGLGGPFDLDDDSSVFKATFGGSFGSLTFGPIAEPGLDESFLLGDLTVTGSLAGGGSLGEVDLIYLPVPEPSTCVMAVIGLLLLLISSGRKPPTA